MKNKLLLITFIISLICTSCAGLYNTPVTRTKVERIAEYEGGDKSAGVILMSVTYNPRTEDSSLDYTGTLLKANQICINWGYKGVRDLQDQTTAKCQAFNYNTGNCILYKAVLKAYCQ